MAKCQFFQCEKDATVRIERASMNCCDEHLRRNEAMFGCKLTTVPVLEPPKLIYPEPSP